MMLEKKLDISPFPAHKFSDLPSKSSVIILIIIIVIIMIIMIIIITLIFANEPAERRREAGEVAAL